MESVTKDHLDEKAVNWNYDLFDRYIEMAAKDPEISDMGLGSPNMPLPDFLPEALMTAVQKVSNNQYTRAGGHVGLVKAAASIYGPRLGREIDPLKEVVLTTGATQAWFDFLEAYIKPGDEVVYFEPIYSEYLAILIEIKKVEVKPISLLDGPDFSFNFEIFKAAFNEKTRCLFLNTPHNPTGKVFSKEEMEKIANFLKENHPQVLVFADNVYSDIHFAGVPHTEMATLPGMWTRTVSSYSFGKAFGATGWRIGITIGPSEIIRAMQNIQEYTIDCLTNPISAAAEIVLKKSVEPYRGFKDYYSWLNAEYEGKYKQVYKILEESPLNLDPIHSGGGYFLIATIERAIKGMPIRYFYKDFETNDHGGKTLQTFDEWTSLEDPDFSPDFAFCYYLVKDYQVVFFPGSAFCDTMYAEPKKKKHVNFVRIAVCKSKPTIEKLAKHLKTEGSLLNKE